MRLVMPSERPGHSVRGTLMLHACQKSMAKPIEWILTEHFAEEVSLDFTSQPLAPAMVRAIYDWRGESVGAQFLVSKLARIPHIRFEVMEHNFAQNTHQRFSYVPSLGIFRADTDPYGNIIINELVLRNILEKSDEVSEALDTCLGTAWDAELEPFRVAIEGDSVRWVHKTVV
jgi:Protein of unknown function (DUF3145)